LKKSFVKSLIRAIVPTLDQLEQEILRQYYLVLYKTQKYVVSDVLIRRKHETIHDELFVFCGSVLAINCFRLIDVDELLPLITQLCEKFFGRTKEEYVSPETIELVNHNMNVIRKLPQATANQTLEQLMAQCDWDNHSAPVPHVRTKTNQDDEQSKIDASLLSRLFRYTSLLNVFNQNNANSNVKGVTEKDQTDLALWIASCKDWLPNFESCHNFFMYFFSEFCSQIRTLMEGEHTLRYWRLVPGYNELLLHYVEYGKAYLSVGGDIGVEFRQWLDSTYIILKNQRFISVLIELFFSNTMGYNLDQVFFTLELIDDWFNELQKMRLAAQQLHANQLVIYYRQRIKHYDSPPYPIEILMSQVPTNFNYALFETAILRLIETDHFQILTRTMIMIYNCLDHFTGKERLKIVFETMLRKNFYRLFLHWSDDVRVCFYRIICYKFRRILRCEETSVKPLRAAPEKLQVIAVKNKMNKFATDTAPKVHKEQDVGRRSLDQLRPSQHVEEETGTTVDDEEEEEEEVAEKPSRKSIDAAESPIQYIHSTSPNLHRASTTASHGSFIDTISITSHELANLENIRNEEAVDLVIQSKIESRITMLRAIIENGGVIPAHQYDYCKIHHEEPCPENLIVYITTALSQLEFIQKESQQWRQTVLEHLRKKKNQLANSGTVTVIPVLYPTLSFPKFSLHEEDG
jgi:hypothetical protein